MPYFTFCNLFGLFFVVFEKLFLCGDIIFQCGKKRLFQLLGDLVSKVAGPSFFLLVQGH